jgi:hypothetical protein
MPETVRTVREMDELILMQDRAIGALQDGIAALNSALWVIKQMIAERGQQRSFSMEVPPGPPYFKVADIPVPYYKFVPAQFPNQPENVPGMNTGGIQGNKLYMTNSELHKQLELNKQINPFEGVTDPTAKFNTLYKE